MKLKTILTVALAIVCCGLSAQDRIHLVDSRRVIEAKIIEIGEVDIIYKLYNNLDGPDYRLSTSRIESIDFENGTRQVFETAGGWRQDRMLTGTWTGMMTEALTIAGGITICTTAGSGGRSLPIT